MFIQLFFFFKDLFSMPPSKKISRRIECSERSRLRVIKIIPAVEMTWVSCGAILRVHKLEKSWIQPAHIPA